MEERHKHIETLLVIALGMTVFHLATAKDYFLFIALGIAVPGLLFPTLAKWIHLAWMGIAKALGFVNSHIIFGLVFFLFLTPLAWIRKLSGKDLLKLKRQKASTFMVSERNYEAKDLKNPW